MASKIHYTTGKQSNTNRQASKTNTGNQKKLVRKIKATGKATLLVLFEGTVSSHDQPDNHHLVVIN